MGGRWASVIALSLVLAALASPYVVAAQETPSPEASLTEAPTSTDEPTVSAGPTEAPAATETQAPTEEPPATAEPTKTARVTFTIRGAFVWADGSPFTAFHQVQVSTQTGVEYWWTTVPVDGSGRFAAEVPWQGSGETTVSIQAEDRTLTTTTPEGCEFYGGWYAADQVVVDHAADIGLIIKVQPIDEGICGASASPASSAQPTEEAGAATAASHAVVTPPASSTNGATDRATSLTGIAVALLFALAGAVLMVALRVRRRLR